MDQQAREQAFVSALATEHLVLQAARSAIVSEQIGRASIYMGAVSSALIALGFLAQVVSRLDPFVTALLPALFVLGELTFAALVRNTIENLVLLGQMQRIRGYYRGPRSQPVLRATRGRRAVSGGVGHRGAAELAGAAVVHRGQSGRREQQHPGWGRPSCPGRTGRRSRGGGGVGGRRRCRLGAVCVPPVSTALQRPCRARR
jgi:hypothetical protein